MLRSTVDLPHPEGPTIVINSPQFGRSSTAKLMFWMAILASGPVPKVLVTFLKTTISGRLEPAAPVAGVDDADSAGSLEAGSGDFAGSDIPIYLLARRYGKSKSPLRRQS